MPLALATLRIRRARLVLRLGTFPRSSLPGSPVAAAAAFAAPPGPLLIHGWRRRNPSPKSPALKALN